MFALEYESYATAVLTISVDCVLELSVREDIQRIDVWRFFDTVERRFIGLLSIEMGEYITSEDT